MSSHGNVAGCAAPAGSAVALVQIGTLTPSGNGLLQGGPQGAASFPNALILYQPGDQYGTAVAMPLNPANGQFDLLEQFATADLYGDLLGYFKSLDLSTLDDRYSAGTSTPEYQIKNKIANGIFLAISLGKNGNPVIAYATTGVRLRRCGDPVCGTTASDVLISAAPALSAKMAIGADGNPVIAYVVGGALQLVKCTDPGCVAMPQVSVIDNTVTLLGAMSVGTDGNPVLAYSYASSRDVRVAQCQTASCGASVSIATIFVGDVTGVGMRVGVDGLPLVAFADTTARAIKLAKCANRACTSVSGIRSIDTSFGGGVHIEVSIAADGLPFVAYTDDTQAALTTFIKCSDPACNSSEKTMQPCGSLRAMLVANDNLPTFIATTGSAWKIGKCSTSNCGQTINISPSGVGSPVYREAGLAFGVDGIPVVGYDTGIAVTEVWVTKCANAFCVDGWVRQ